jgi:uncharacterized membrane protein
MEQFFSHYAHTVVFFHVLGAIVWIGGMIAVYRAVHPVMHTIEDRQLRLEKNLQITGRLFNLVLPFILLILATGLLMALATDGHRGPHRNLFLAKEGIWTVMALNYAFMYYRRAKAWGRFLQGDLPGAAALAAKIPHLLLPLNILLGITALWLGVSLRGY